MPVRLASRLFSLLWDTETASRGFVTRCGASLLRLVTAVLRDVREDGVRQRAKGLVYTTLLSLAPLLALSFSVLKGFGVHNQLEPFLLGLLAPLGENSADIAQRIVTFVENVRVGVLGVVGLCVLIFGVVTMMTEIESAFNDIWRVRRARSFASRVRDYLGVLLVGPFLLFASMALSAGLRHAVLLEKWLGEGVVTQAMVFAGPLFAWLLFAVAFAALYMIIPNVRVRLGPALVAGMVTGVMWKILGRLFSFFVQGSASYEAIYSAFAVLILFMIWLYAGWMVVLAGASVSYYLQNPSNRRLSRRDDAFSPRVQEKIALQVCVAVGGSFYRGTPLPTADDLAARMKIPALAVEKVASALAKAGVLAYTGGYLQQMIPARPFDMMPVESMLQDFRAADEGLGLNAAHVVVTPEVEGFLHKRDTVLENMPDQPTLKDMALFSGTETAKEKEKKKK